MEVQADEHISPVSNELKSAKSQSQTYTRDLVNHQEANLRVWAGSLQIKMI